MRNKMAPFKLKFRMGSSRSTSQEHDPDPQVSEALLGPAQQQQQQQQQQHHQQTHGAHHPQQQQPQQQQQHVLQHHQHAQHTQSPLLGIGASTSTIDSTDCHSLSSVSTNERKSLLPSQHKTNTMRLGYLNQCGSNDTTTLGSQLPKTPPPSYEHVLEENTRLAHSFEYAKRQQQHHQQSGSHHHLRQHSGQLSADGGSEHSGSAQHSRLSSQQNSRSSTLFTSLERLTLGSSGQCTDPECRENFLLLSNDRRLRRQQEIDNEASDSGAEHLEAAITDSRNNNDENDGDDDDDEGNNDNVARPDRVGCDEAQDIDDDNRKESIDSTELLLSRDNMSDFNGDQGEDASGCSGGMLNDGNEACGGDGGSDDGLCHEKNCPDDDHYNDGLGQEQTDSDEDQHWQQQQMCYQQHQQEQQAQYDSSVISNKSSKEIYKDLAKQWGITCKMSDGCRCMDCQSNYFDCEFDHNEHQKTDGGLGAGTPMFISEVMHGSACTIL